MGNLAERAWKAAGVALLAMAVMPGPAGGAGGSGTTAGQPAQALVSASDVRAWLGQLADVDQEARDSARAHLLSLHRADLPTLRSAAADAQPLNAAQMAELPEIVRHVYLTEEPYEYQKPASGFLGLRWPQPADLVPGLIRDDPPLVVEERLPGFAAYSALETGDIILEVADIEFKPASRDEFIFKVKDLPPGRVVQLVVRRRGQIVQIPVTLGNRPVPPAGDERLDYFVAHRMEAAEKYWEREFEPILQRQGVVAVP